MPRRAGGTKDCDETGDSPIVSCYGTANFFYICKMLQDEGSGYGEKRRSGREFRRLPRRVVLQATWHGEDTRRIEYGSSTARCSRGHTRQRERLRLVEAANTATWTATRSTSATEAIRRSSRIRTGTGAVSARVPATCRYGSRDTRALGSTRPSSSARTGVPSGGPRGRCRRATRGIEPKRRSAPLPAGRRGIA